MADVSYPCDLPAFQVIGTTHRSKDRVKRNDLDSGPPVFILDDDDGYDTHDGQIILKSPYQVQLFKNWYRYAISSGSKLFNMDLWVDGSDGSTNTRTHECYVLGVPRYTQNGKNFNVSLSVLAIEEQILDECEGFALVNASNGFAYSLHDAILDLDTLITTMESRWQP